MRKKERKRKKLFDPFEQRNELNEYVKTIKKDEIVPLSRGENEHIITIIRGRQSFYMNFPKEIKRDITYSFETKGDISSGFCSIERSGKRGVKVNFMLQYPEEWYWTITVDKKSA